MGLPRDAHHLALVVDHGEAVVMMRAVRLEEAGGDVDLQLRRELLHRKHGGMLLHRAGACEQALVFHPARIMSLEQFRREAAICAFTRRRPPTSLNGLDISPEHVYTHHCKRGTPTT